MLNCRAIGGIPTPTVVWSRRDRIPISNLVEERSPGTITISNISIADAGDYVCKATNIAGEVTQTTSIRVQQRPIIRILPETNEWTITEGDELKLECSAMGLPSPSVQFKRYGQSDDGMRAQPSPFGPSQSLIQKYNAGRNDEGTYVCHATNEAGEDQKYITVIVEPKRGDVGKFISMKII